MYNDFLLRLYSERRRLGVFFSPEIRGSGEAQSRDFGIENSTGIPRDSNLVQLGRIHHTVSGLSWRHLYAFEQAMAEVWVGDGRGLGGRTRPRRRGVVHVGVGGRLGEGVPTDHVQGLRGFLRPRCSRQIPATPPDQLRDSSARADAAKQSRRHTSKAGLLTSRTHRFSSRMRYCFEFT